jgi:hypothetical protein
MNKKMKKEPLGQAMKKTALEGILAGMLTTV